MIDKIIYNLDMSVRKIKKSYISCTGYFASYKNKRQIAFESVLERDFYMLLEFDYDVVKYEEQPLSINYEYFDGGKRKYTPDVLVTYKNKKEFLYEIKYMNEIMSNIELSKKIDLLKKTFSHEHNITFMLFTDNDVNKIYLDNLKFLYNYAFIPENEIFYNKINDVLNSIDSISVSDLLNKLESNKYKQLQLLPYIWFYVFKKPYVANLFHKLTMKSLLKK